MRFTKEVIEKLQFNPSGPSSQQVWEDGRTNLGIRLSSTGRHVWIARVYVSQPNGTYHRRIGGLFRHASVRDRSVEEARREKLIWDAEAAQGIDPLAKRRPGALEGPATVSLLMRVFLKEHVAVELDPGTQDDYEKLSAHLIRFMGDRPLVEVDEELMAAFRKSLADRRPTFNKARRVLSSACRRAQAIHWQHEGLPLVPKGCNPALLVPAYDTTATRRGGDPFEPEEIAALIAVARDLLADKARRHAPSHAAVAYPLLLLFTGMRKEEGLGLSWRDLGLPKVSGWSGWVDRRRECLRLIHHKTSRKKGPKEVPLTAQARWVLDELGQLDETWVFPGNISGQRLKTPYPAWYSLQRRAGVRGRGLHQLRHTFITRALEAGAPIGAVAKAVGHTTVHITEIYGHISDRSARSAAVLAGDEMHRLDFGVGCEGSA